LEFDAENAGATIQCPHCGTETVLFVPSVPVAQPERGLGRSAKGWILFAGLLAAGLLIGVVIFHAPNSRRTDAQETNQIVASVTESPPPAAQEEKPQFEPVTGAFGWKLGDRVPDDRPALEKAERERLSRSFGRELGDLMMEGNKRDKDDGLHFMFKPPTPTPPFDIYSVALTRDRRIYEIKALVVEFDGELDWKKTVKMLDSVLAAKYGRTREPETAMHDEGTSFSETFYYGGNGREVELSARASYPKLHVRTSTFVSVGLTYHDLALSEIARQEAAETKKAADEAAKRALRNSGL